MSPMFSAVAQWDVAASVRMNRLNRWRACAQAFALVSRLGDGWIWCALMIAIPLARGPGALPLVAVMAANGLACTIAYGWLKGRTQRRRPCDAHATLCLTVAPLDRFSFPSGHTLHAVAFTVIAAWAYPVLGWLLMPFATLVAVSRLVLGLHYPSDVLVGAAIGALMSAIAVLLAGVSGIVPV